jgi:hypothetical protein
MTRVLLCAGPSLLVVSRDGTLFFRRPGQPDARVPYAPEHYPVFLHSAQHKHDLNPAVGPQGEEGPTIPDDAHVPELHLDRLPTGEMVYRIAEAIAERSQGNQADDLESTIGAPTGSSKD